MAVKKTSVTKKSANISVPTGVKIISILYLIGSIFLALAGILSFVGGSFVGALFSSIPIIGLLGAGFFAIIGILVLAFAVLCFLISRALKEAKSWARIVVIVLCTISALSELMALISGDFGSIISLAINLWIGGYLLLNKEAKAFFGK